jgi:sulfur transfer complex TusBCD TusB component (DsrH family)
LKKTLYIVSKAPIEESVFLLPTDSSSKKDVSVVLIQDGVRHQNLPFPHVFTLSDDVLSQKLSSPFPSVSYQDLLRMIFEAETVAVL